MAERFDLIVKGGTCLTPGGAVEADVGVRDGRIAAIGGPGRLSLARLVDLVSAGPARVYNVAGKGRLAVGYDADLTLVDLAARREIKNDWIASKCGWTPYDGTAVTGWPMATVVRGAVVMREGELLGAPQGIPVRFAECL